MHSYQQTTLIMTFSIYDAPTFSHFHNIYILSDDHRDIIIPCSELNTLFYCTYPNFHDQTILNYYNSKRESFSFSLSLWKEIVMYILADYGFIDQVGESNDNLKGLSALHWESSFTFPSVSLSLFSIKLSSNDDGSSVYTCPSLFSPSLLQFSILACWLFFWKYLYTLRSTRNNKIYIIISLKFHLHRHHRDHNNHRHQSFIHIIIIILLSPYLSYSLYVAGWHWTGFQWACTRIHTLAIFLSSIFIPLKRELNENPFCQPFSG